MRQRALEYLGKREYSVQELGQKLKGFADETDDIEALLIEFKNRGFVSDQRFTDQVVHARQNKFGSAKIAHELREKGIEEHLIADALIDIKSNEFQHATEVWRKKFKTAPKNREDWAKQARFLQSRGYSFDLIKKVLMQSIEEFE